MEYVDDPHAEFVRKVGWLTKTALIETVSYVLLLWAWLGGHQLTSRILGSVHGMIWLAFVAMLLEARRPMRWTWNYVAFVIITGPVGAVAAYERIRRQGIPADARTL